MIKGILSLFTTEEKVSAMLSHPIIEMIFFTLFSLFFVSVFLHFALYIKIKRVRQHLQQTGTLTIEPLQTMKKEFIEKQKLENIAIETFVQERFSRWKIFHLPMIQLIQLTKMTVSVFILLGVLGTFIGLTISLGSMSIAEEQLLQNISVVLSGIDVAFYTSIVGMSFSLMMTLLLKLLNTEYMLTELMLMTESKLIKEHKKGLPKLIEVSETIHGSIQDLQITHEKSLAGIIDAFSGFKNYTDGLIQAAKDLDSFNKGLRENLQHFQGIFEETRTMAKTFHKGTTVLNDNFDQLFTFITESEQRQQKSLKLFEQTYENITAANRHQTETIHTLSDTMASFKTFSEDLLTEQQKISQTMQNIHQESRKFTEQLEGHNQRLSKIFGNHLSDQIGNVAQNVHTLAGHFHRMEDAFNRLPSALEAIDETQEEYRYLLAERFREIERFNESFQNHLRQHSEETINFDTKLREALTSFDQVEKRNYELLNELHRVAQELMQGYQRRDQDQETMLRMLQDALANYMMSVERTFSEKLESIIREISESIRGLSRDIQGEIYDIQRRTEEIQERQAEGMSRLYEGFGRELQRTLQEVARGMRNVSSSPSAHPTVPVKQELGWYDHDR